MNKQQAKKLIRDTFESPFDKERFIFFIKNLLNKIEEKPFSYQGNYIPDLFKPYISKLERIGKYYNNENEIDLLIVSLKKETSLQKARTIQRNFIAWYLKGSRGGKLKDAALVAFVSPDEEDWRFSLVKMDYRWEKTPSGMMKVKEEFTPARRWSFLVGKNEKSHTAQSRLVSILEDDEHNPTLAQLEEAFNIEPVTKEFFDKYRTLLIRTVEELDKIVERDKKIKEDFESKNIKPVDFAKKLLGQIVFLYFLQKKGWFGVERDADWGTGPKDFLRRLFNKEYGDYTNFFNDILEPLFYEALARQRDDDFYSRFNCKIPFLNGGLFEPIGGYDWVHTDIILPDELFSNTRRTPEGDIGDGILDVFDRFNFTVKEDEPLEKEVAIDPELLGKLYEKFNAIREDNFYEYKKALASGKKNLEKQFNKKFGVYYTPREIVHYMCQQSLIYYLEQELQGKVSKEDIEKLIKYGEQFTENETTALLKEQLIEEGIQKGSSYKFKLPESIRKNARLIDDKLKSIKICDPAIGSGAFPVGMMHEIVKTRNVLSAFINEEGRTTYNFKRECIENSLYGVDIDAGACEVAKLRLWLSLIVDEEDIRKIKPLPNLDYKIMQGNSLISEFMGINFDEEQTSKKEQLLLTDDDVDNLVEILKEKKREYLNKTSINEKQVIRKEIEDLIIKIFEKKLSKQKQEYFRKLRAIEERYKSLPNVQQRESFIQQEKDKLYKTTGFNLEQIEQQLREYTSGNKARPFFPWQLYFAEVFHEKGGFDVVIANPPYGIVYDKLFKQQLLKSYPSFKRNNDIYIAFYERGLGLLKTTGVLTYISPNTFLNGDYFRDFRRLLTSKTFIREIFDFKELHIFGDPTVFVCTICCQGQHEIKFPYKYKLKVAENSLKLFSVQSIVLNGPTLNSLTLKNSLYSKLINEDDVNLAGELFYIKDVGFNYWTKGRGKKRGEGSIGNRVFYSGKQKSKKDIPFLKGRDISRYHIKKPTNFLIHNYHQFLDPQIDILRFTPAFLELKPKIVYRQTANKIIAAVDTNGYYLDKTVHLIVPKNRSSYVDMKYILGLLNSTLFNYLYAHIAQEREGRAFAQVKTTYIKRLPIKICNVAKQKSIIDLVDKILSLTQSEDYLENPQKQAKVKEYEREIDQLVYKLYELTEEEIKIVEGVSTHAKNR